MELTIILLQQLLTMMIYMAIGYCLYKQKLITSVGGKELGNILLRVVMPTTIINSYLVEYTVQKAQNLLISCGLALFTLIIAMFVASLLFRKKKIERFGVAFSNAGFMGIPIVNAVLGMEAVFYISSFVAFLNIFQWTYGVAVMTESTDSIKGKNFLKNPIIIATIIGNILFFSRISVSALAEKAIVNLSALNAPLAMILLGTYLAQTDIFQMFKQGSVYWSSIVRLLLIPILTGAILVVIPAEREMKLAILIAASAPIGSNVAIFAQIYQQDYQQAVKEICISTLCCIVTLPIVVGAVSLIL